MKKLALKQDLFVPVSISDIKDVPTLAALFEVDSNYGRWAEPVASENNEFIIGGRKIPYFDSMKSLPDWNALGVDLGDRLYGPHHPRRRPGASQHRRQARPGQCAQ